MSRRSAAAERLRHGHLLTDNIQKRPCRHPWLQPPVTVETDLHQQVNYQPHIVEDDRKAEVEHSNSGVPGGRPRKDVLDRLVAVLYSPPAGVPAASRGGYAAVLSMSRHSPRDLSRTSPLPLSSGPREP